MKISIKIRKKVEIKLQIISFLGMGSGGQNKLIMTTQPNLSLHQIVLYIYIYIYIYIYK